MSGYPAIRTTWRAMAGRWQPVAFLLPVLIAVGIDMAVVLPSASDTGVYQRYAHAALNSPLLHSLPKEYPAAALAIYLLPLLLPVKYLITFAVITALGTVALVLCSDGLAAHPGWSRRTTIYLLVGAGAIIFGRYDVFPALATFLAVEAARRDRWGRAWAWVVVGGLLKLFPFLLLPGFLFAEHARTGRWAVRRAAVACVPVALMVFVQSILSPGSVLSPVRYELNRDFELESLSSSLTLLTDPLHVKWKFQYGGWEIFGAYHNVIAVAVLLATITGILAVWRFAALGRLSVEATSLAVLSVSVLGDKAFSPQYLIWLAPLWAYWPLRRGWLAAAALTTLVFPFLYIEATRLGPSYYFATGAASLRNVVLAVATACWAREQLRARQTTKIPFALGAGEPARHDYATVG
jgi:hypothetical protein